MTIKILGTRGKIKEKRQRHSKHSGILIDDKILVDIGEKEYLNYNPEIIFITHLHPDHAFFVEGHDKVEIEVPVYAPEESKKMKNIKIISKPVDVSGYRFIPIPTIHSLKLRSQGYIIEKDGKRLFYSGDLVAVEPQYEDKLKNLDLVITEGSFIRRGGMVKKDPKTDRAYGHTGIPDLVNMFKASTNHIVFTHFGTWFMNDVPKAKKKIMNLENHGLELEVACDGKEFFL